MAEKKGFGQRLQDFMASYRGRVIMNYAYSWGAAIVIAGTLFKLTHLPGANLMLWIGMGTEVLVFFISAFELPRRDAESAASTSGAGGKIAPPAAMPATPPAVMPVTPKTVPLVTPEMEATTQEYIDRLKETTEMLARFTAQAESLSHDADQMSALNRNLSGINAIYEMQLRSAGAQITTIDQVHEQTRKMVRQIEELNAVYARMLQAVQVKS
ncbi:MAG: gliding motility protein GldL [Prevotellaceae bacterium]|jgi:hypothetical protein|nr:gliding motility protein GldL [Prevotellaceae bacterium]